MITRVDAADRLVGMYGAGPYNLLDQAGIVQTDTQGGLKEVIDDAVIALSGDFDLLATGIASTSAMAYFAVLDYFALNRIIVGLNRRSDIDVGVGEGVYLKGSQLAAKLQERWLAARERCSALGVAVDDVSGSVGGDGVPAGGFRFSLDYLEPVGEVSGL